ncbi:MAG: helix-turn-helix domain-containing protein [Solirubrobacterales bacterium]
MSYKKLGQRIQQAREEAGFSQEQLAKMLGCSQPTLSNYEKGKSRLYLAQLQKFAELLDKPASYFLEAMEPDYVEIDALAPEPIQFVAGGDAVVNVNQDILEIVKVLKELPRESRKSVYDYALWQQYRLGRNNNGKL